MDKIKTTIVAGGLVVGVIFGYDNLTISDTEIQKYIQDSLISGCRPVINICTSDCNQRDITKDVKAECLPAKVLRVSAERATDNYIKLAKKNNVEILALNDLPIKLRDKLSDKGVVLSPIKEDLSK